MENIFFYPVLSGFLVVGAEDWFCIEIFPTSVFRGGEGEGSSTSMLL